MLLSRSPPKSQQHTKSGGSSPIKFANTSAAKAISNLSSPPSTSSSSSLAASSRSTAHSPLLSGNSSCRTGSSLSLYSNSSTAALLPEGIRSNNSGGSSSSRDTNSGLKSTAHSHYHHHHYMQHSHSHYGSSGGGGGSGGRKSGGSSSASSKRGKKHNWGSRERAGMSFLIVIAFFAVFGLIILTELFMIDEKTHGGMIVLRHGNQGSRLGDSMPDYDNVKDDYDLLEDSLLSDNKLGFVQFHDNKLKIQDASTGDAGRSQAGILFNSAVNGYVVGAGAGIGGGGIGGGSASVPIIPWGKVLPNKIEETLPRYPIGMQPTDGSWQVVNGTRFKFFVFSAYYDRRDGAKLVRVIGATKTRGPERVWCRFWYVNSRNGTETSTGRQTRTSSATVMARVKIIRENWNLKYSACFVLCPIRAPDIDVPQYVSVVSRLRAPPGNILQLRNTDSDTDFPANRSGSIRSTMANTSYASASSSVASSSSASATSANSALPTGDQIPDKIAICVKPFHFNYDQALYLMEYLEFYALMGVSHFTFYNHTTGPHSTCVLRHYMNGDVPDTMTATDEDYTAVVNLNAATNAQQTPNQQQQQQQQKQQEQQQQKPIKRRISTNYVKPTINILPWNLRMRSQKEIRTEGLFAALNDCLYRTMYRYKYLALVDLDEFIIPRNNDTLNELINSLNQRFRNRNTGAYSFQNAFFYLQFADDPLLYQEPEKSLNPRLRAALVTQRKTRRRFKLHPQKQRSKYICKPEAVIEAGNHFVWEFSPGKGSLNVPPTDAILHHYRVCEFGGNDCIKAPSIIDRTATKYANRLLQRVDAVYNYLKEPCNLPDLPKLPAQPPAVTLAQKYQPQQQPQQQQQQQQSPQHHNTVTPTKARITKIINDFKVKLKEKIKANNEHRTTNSTQSGTSTITSATETKDNEYDDPNRIVVFEQDSNGQTIVQVKYAVP